MWCPYAQDENYYLGGESCYPNPEPPGSVSLPFLPHRFSLLPLCNRAACDLKAIGNPVTSSWTDMLLLTLIT